MLALCFKHLLKFSLKSVKQQEGKSMDKILKQIAALEARIVELEDEAGIAEKLERIAKAKAQKEIYLAQGMSGREASRRANNDVHFGRI